MLWDTARMIDHNRRALLRLLTGLFVMAGFEPGTGLVDVLPRVTRAAILKVLRQIESATRRMIVVEARGLEIPAYVPPATNKKGQSKTSRHESNGTKTRPPQIPRFQLIDPRVFMEELYPNRRQRRSKPKSKAGPEPRLLFRIAGMDGQPDYEEWSDGVPELSPDDLLTAKHICRRMQAVYHALSDLPKQAQRLVRELAKRAAAPPGPGRVPPLRRGPPPGHRNRHVHPVDEILADCHFLATAEPVPPDRE